MTTENLRPSSSAGYPNRVMNEPVPPPDLWERMDKAYQEHQLAYKRAEESRLLAHPAGPFCVSDYAKFRHIGLHWARERVQYLKDRGVIRLHMWVRTANGRVPYYTGCEKTD